MKNYLVLLPMLSVLSACGTIEHGPSQKIAIESIPRGATVSVDGKSHGAAPLTLRLARVASHRIRVELSGYQPTETILVSRAWKDFQEHPSDALIALIPVNTPSMIIDTLTTAAWALDTLPSANVERIGGHEKFTYGELNGLRFRLQKQQPTTHKHASSGRPSLPR